MAGLPCDNCGEETYVIPTGEVIEDQRGVTVYRRYRVCVNRTCAKYKHRREAWETLLPDTEPPRLVDTVQLRQYLPPDPDDPENEQQGLFRMYSD